MSKIYYYKMTVDNGGAPAVQDRLLSLAICKPEIRRCAQPGDWVMGFGANSFEFGGRRIAGNPLVYMARITGRKPDGAYYSESRYLHRPDCIYERLDGRFRLRSGARYHLDPVNLPHDVGEPPAYPKATVLLSDDFRYFASGGTTEYRRRFPDLTEIVAGIGRGHRVAHPGTAAFERLRRLQQSYWREAQDAVAEPDAAAPPARTGPPGGPSAAARTTRSRRKC